MDQNPVPLIETVSFSLSVPDTIFEYVSDVQALCHKLCSPWQCISITDQVVIILSSPW